MKKSYICIICFLTLILIAGCACGRTAAIGTYNIQIGRGLDRKYDLSRTVDAIRLLNAETVILNEVDVKTDRSDKVDQAAFLAEKLKMNYVFGEASKRPGGIYGNAVLSIHKLEKLDVIDLPATARESRSALVVKVHAPIPYYVIATHFAWEQKPEIEAQRIKCIDLIADYIDAKKYSPVIFGGDLNSHHDSAVIRRMQERKFKVLNDVNGKMFSYSSGNPDRLLDYLTIYPANSAGGKNIRTVNTQSSDHLPVAADFIFGSL